MNSLFIGIAFTPLAAYFFLIGLLNFRSSPAVTSGARDMAALMLATSGMVLVGPCLLLMPESIYNRFPSPWGWVILLVLYLLLCNMILLMMRPRIVVYNISRERLREILKTVVAEIDPKAEWAGNGAHIPRLGIQLHIDGSGMARNVQIASSGPRQNIVGWHRLQWALAARLREVRSPRNPWAFFMLGLSSLGIAGILINMCLNGPAVKTAFCELLRLF